MFYGRPARKIFKHRVDILIPLLAEVIACSVNSVMTCMYSLMTVNLLLNGTHYP